MQHIFIKDFKEGLHIDCVYLVREKSFDTAKNGSSYISIELTDKTGTIDTRKWDAVKSHFDSFNIDDFVRVKGTVEIYKKYPQLKLDYIEQYDPSKVDISLYIPTINKDRNSMMLNLFSEIKHIEAQSLQTLLNNIFTNKEIADKFKTAPSATDFHHPYLGGLLEHTLACIDLAKIIASKYPYVNQDLLVTSAALHDIGKLEELSYKKSFYYTDKGRLLGHIILGVLLIENEIKRIPDFPNDLKNLLLHIILSHHGELEWGSPKRPMCIEAIVLHYIDNLDAKVNGFRYFVTTYNNDTSTNWTKHSKMFKEFLYKKPISDFMEETFSKQNGGTI